MQHKLPQHLLADIIHVLPDNFSLDHLKGITDQLEQELEASEQLQLELGLDDPFFAPLTSDDAFFISDSSDEVIAKVNGRYYIWNNIEIVSELIPTPH